MTNDNDLVRLTITTPRQQRLRFEDLRLRRARRDGGLPPPLTDLMNEAFETFLEREQRGTWTYEDRVAPSVGPQPPEVKRADQL
jgi:hypothetical protein